MKNHIIMSLFAFMLFPVGLHAQEYYFTNAKTLTVIGKANADTSFYCRIDTSKYNNMPAAVKHLLTNTAGMAIAFTTNSNSIIAKWTLPKESPHGNMTLLMRSGLDLYIKLKGEWTHAGIASPGSISSQSTLVTGMIDGSKECLVYLPLYNGIQELEIGVSVGSVIKPSLNPFAGKVVIYGSSITQGASASRPGLSYPSMLARRSGINFINLGLSGSGRMEPTVATMIADIEADAYVLDCAANPTAKEITERTAGFVHTIRNKHADAPIIMIESVVREGGTFNQNIKQTVAAQNTAFKEEYLKLKRAGIKKLYLIESNNFLGADHEGTVDGTHPNDLGFARFVDVLQPQLFAILQELIKEK